MDIAWLGPLIAGAVLTYGAGSLEAARSRRHQLRRDGREHLLRAFELANAVGMDVHNKQAEERFASDPVDYQSPMFWELAALDELMPDPKLRRAIREACRLVQTARAAQQLGAWEEPAGRVQRDAMFQLRVLLGAAVRGERKLPGEALGWLADRAREIGSAIDEASSR